jgi:serine/threonine-protein kinase RsbW
MRMKEISSLVLPANLENLTRFIASTLDAAGSAGIEPEKMFSIELAVEETLVNIISHGYDGTEKDIRLRCGTDSRHLFVIEITDRGRAFDVGTAMPPELTDDLERRNIGGLGMHLVRSLVDEVVYRREGTENIAELRIAPRTGGVGYPDSML